MEYRQLGSTGLRVSKIALGGATLSKLFSDDFDREEGIRTVQEAIRSAASRGTWSWESWPCTIRCNWMGRPPSSSASPTESCCGLTWTRSSTASLPTNRKCCSICAKTSLPSPTAGAPLYPR
ncbi:GM26051 [Drosophila sechellia]|uniref:GM26051 n=1 Tax=Drosophila sechellia TaxID=7238 RepID=B4HHI8_DROSE|nr:GM26051 [Drosophila sechellia]